MAKKTVETERALKARRLKKNARQLRFVNSALGEAGLQRVSDILGKVFTFSYEDKYREIVTICGKIVGIAIGKHAILLRITVYVPDIGEMNACLFYNRYQKKWFVGTDSFGPDGEFSLE